MSVNVFARKFQGQKWLHQCYGGLGFLALSAGKKKPSMPIKFLVLGGEGGFGFGGGGGQCQFYFYGHRDFSEKQELGLVLLGSRKGIKEKIA